MSTDAASELHARLAGLDDPNDRARHAAAVVLERFEARGVELTVVGGSAVALWDPHLHVSRDVDLVGAAAPSDAEAVMVRELGFRTEGRHWVHDELELAFEVPAWTLEPEGAAVAMVDGIRVISLEDLILDRVQQWHATGAYDSWRQAARLLAHPALDVRRLRSRANEFGATAPLTAVVELARRPGGSRPVDPPLSHAVHAALGRDDLAAVRRLLAAP
jgi:hypothetical protein